MVSVPSFDLTHSCVLIRLGEGEREGGREGGKEGKRREGGEEGGRGGGREGRREGWVHNAHVHYANWAWLGQRAHIALNSSTIVMQFQPASCATLSLCLPLLHVFNYH